MLYLDVVPSSCKGCYSLDAWTAEATFSKLHVPEKKKWPRFLGERHFICFGFVSYGWAFFCFSACLAIHHFAVYLVLESSIKETLTATATSIMAV